MLNLSKMAKKIKVAPIKEASESLKRRKIEHECSILKVKNFRHYELAALSHGHYRPTFDCTCRGCGKTFEHVDPNAKWCSKECHNAWRKQRKVAYERKDS